MKNKDKRDCLRRDLYIGDDDSTVIYKKTWKERLFSLRPWKSWTTKNVWVKKFNELRALSEIPDSWKRVRPENRQYEIWRMIWLPDLPKGCHAKSDLDCEHFNNGVCSISGCKRARENLYVNP